LIDLFYLGSVSSRGVEEANGEMQNAILRRNMKGIQEAQARMTMALEAKKRWSSTLDTLNKSKKN